ncbi:MAG: hypothetical protein JNN12_15680 [Bacteroidetes Order II. Incertae sedis bacterium]|nr:hypothetical protein [Bacteroidetes Order II. bacterium]
MRKKIGFWLATILLSTAPSFAQPVFEISFSKTLSLEPLDGRIILMFTKDNTSEPKSQVRWGLNAIPIFGKNAESWRPNQPQVIDHTIFGYPYESLKDLPAGEYYVQAALNRYETFNLKTGHQVKLPRSWDAGQNWRKEPGNLFSKPQKLRIDPTKKQIIRLNLTEINPEITPPKDTPYIRHIKIQSKLLTEFWGRPMYLGAHVLVPEGFDAHPEARYPLMLFHGHFPADFGGFRTSAPDPSLICAYSERFRLDCYNRIEQQEAYNFYQKWISKDFPRYLVVEIQHANPYYDDSYAVNSANLGPYGDAIMTELLPAIEQKFRGIGEGWARFTYGGSTGGWEALAAQVFYPEAFNGAFAACPDPVDFRAYTLVNLYEDKNAYTWHGPHREIEKPGYRNYLGEVTATVRDQNHYELVLGDKSRSGDQWDIWEAVYSPQGSDGYPKRIFDKKTGKINPEVAAYWRENYDLRHIMERDWAKLGPKLQGKIHLYCGDMDNYYLNNAVYLMEDFLRNRTQNPKSDAVIAYGDRAEHCWNGDPENPNAISRLRYNWQYLPMILKRIEDSAPPGADVRSWRY